MTKTSNLFKDIQIETKNSLSKNDHDPWIEWKAYTDNFKFEPAIQQDMLKDKPAENNQLLNSNSFKTYNLTMSPEHQIGNYFKEKVNDIHVKDIDLVKPDFIKLPATYFFDDPIHTSYPKYQHNDLYKEIDNEFLDKIDEMSLKDVQLPNEKTLSKTKEKTRRVRSPFKKGDRITTPKGVGTVWCVDMDGTICVQLSNDDDSDILYEFDKKEVKKIKP